MVLMDSKGGIYRTRALTTAVIIQKDTFLNPRCSFFSREAIIQEIFFIGILALKNPLLELEL